MDAEDFLQLPDSSPGARFGPTLQNLLVLLGHEVRHQGVDGFALKAVGRDSKEVIDILGYIGDDSHSLGVDECFHGTGILVEDELPKLSE